MRRLSSSILLLAVTLVLLGSAEADKPVRMSGQGGFPLTDSVTSMWGAVDELVSRERPKPLTFMIYFVGKPKWHEGKWSFSSNMDKDPAFIEFSGPVVLRAEFRRESRVLSVFGSDFAISEANVFVVENVDVPELRRVVGLGLVDLNPPADANPAVQVLQQHERIRNAVLATGK